MDKITLNKETMLDCFLSPISKITDQAVIAVKEKNLSCLTSNEDATIILYALVATEQKKIKSKDIKLGMPDIKKFNRALTCIDDEELELSINSNNIEYTNKNVNFKYHLLDSDILQKNIVSTEKIAQLTFDGNFTITPEYLKDIMRATMFSSETNKIYFSFKGSNVLGNLTDKKIQNSDSFETKIADDYSGEKIDNEVIIDLDIFRLFPNIKRDIKVKINRKLKILMFEIKDKDYMLKYIVSSLSS